MASDVVTFLATFLSWSEASLLFALIVCRPLLALVNIWIYNVCAYHSVLVTCKCLWHMNILAHMGTSICIEGVTRTLIPWNAVYRVLLWTLKNTVYVTVHEKTMHNAPKKIWVKATITNYNLWTIAPANLKSLACVVMEIWAKIYPDCLYCKKLQWTLLRTLHAEVRILVVYGKYVAPPTKSMS